MTGGVRLKIWLDLANSPQVLFFRPILAQLQRQGHVVTMTTRAYAQTVQLADQFGFAHTTIGQHGGRGFRELVWQNFLRAVALAKWARKQRFDLALSHNAYSQVVAASLLRLPAVTLMDYEHQPLNHLCFRLARRVVVPEAFPADLLQKYGAGRKVYTYPGVKEQLYLADFVPQPDYRQREGLPVDRLLIVIRPPAPWTAYHRFENDLFDHLLAQLAAKKDAFVLFLPRLPEQAESIKHLSGVHVADRVYDGPNLLHSADLVVSGGGTMNREAAVLGTPVYTLFKGKLGSVDQYLIQQGRMTQICNIGDINKIDELSRKMPSRERDRLPEYDLVATVTNLITAGGN